MQLTPILDEYKRIFIECAAAEMHRADDTEVKFIESYINRVSAGIKLHTFFAPAALSSHVLDIFEHNAVRDYVLCLTDRYLIAIAGNENISFTKLVLMVSCLGESNVGDNQNNSLLPEIIPQAVRSAISPEPEFVKATLIANKFLIIPIMLYLNMGSALPAIEGKSK